MRRPRGPRRIRDRVWWLTLRDGSVMGWYRCPWAVAPPLRFADGLGDWMDVRDHTRGWYDLMKRPTVGVPMEGAVPMPYYSPVLLESYPMMAELLVAAAWEDGTPKGDVTLWFSIQPGMVKGLLALKGLKLKAMLTARSLDEWWELAEGCCEQDRWPWEQDVERGSAPRKKSG